MLPTFTNAGLEFFKEIQGQGLKFVFLFEHQGVIHGQSSIDYNESRYFLDTVFGKIPPCHVSTPFPGMSSLVRPIYSSPRSLAQATVTTVSSSPRPRNPSLTMASVESRDHVPGVSPPVVTVSGPCLPGALTNTSASRDQAPAGALRGGPLFH